MFDTERVNDQFPDRKIGVVPDRSMAFQVEPGEIARASKNIVGLFTHVRIVERKLQMCDASQMLVSGYEVSQQFISVMKADVLIVGQPALPCIYCGYEMPILTILTWHRQPVAVLGYFSELCPFSAVPIDIHTRNG